jgi:protoheme IX farnesyltransferase
LVGSANTLNMWLEREVDGKMARTAKRPLPAGRLSPGLALVFGLVQAAVSIPLLALGANPLTGALGALALVLYVLVYTPMKRISTVSLLIGAIPGAMPPLLGWTALTNDVSAPAIAVFAVMFLWQVPHFIAITLFRTNDYTRAGLKVLPATRGEAVAKRILLGYLVAQIIATLMLVPLGLGGLGYVIAAGVLGLWMLWLGAKGLAAANQGEAGGRWARGFFIGTIAYLPLLFAALLVFPWH